MVYAIDDPATKYAYHGPYPQNGVHSVPSKQNIPKVVGVSGQKQHSAPALWQPNRRINAKTTVIRRQYVSRNMTVKMRIDTVARGSCRLNSKASISACTCAVTCRLATQKNTSWSVLERVLNGKKSVRELICRIQTSLQTGDAITGPI